MTIDDCINKLQYLKEKGFASGSEDLFIISEDHKIFLVGNITAPKVQVFKLDGACTVIYGEIK